VYRGHSLWPRGACERVWHPLGGAQEAAKAPTLFLRSPPRGIAIRIRRHVVPDSSKYHSTPRIPPLVRVQLYHGGRFAPFARFYWMVVEYQSARLRSGDAGAKICAHGAFRICIRICIRPPQIPFFNTKIALSNDPVND